MLFGGVLVFLTCQQQQKCLKDSKVMDFCSPNIKSSAVESGSLSSFILFYEFFVLPFNERTLRYCDALRSCFFFFFPTNKVMQVVFEQRVRRGRRSGIYQKNLKMYKRLTGSHFEPAEVFYLVYFCLSGQQFTGFSLLCTGSYRFN